MNLKEKFEHLKSKLSLDLIALRVVESQDYTPFDTMELILKTQRGELGAFEELVRRYEKMVYSLAFQMLNNHDDADDVLQDAFVKVYKSLINLKNPSAFLTWLHRIVVNLSIDFARKKNRWVELHEQAEELDDDMPLISLWPTNPELIYKNRKLMELVQEAVMELPPRQRAVIILHEVKGYSKKEIGRILKCPQGTVRSNLHYAREKLKKRLEKHINL
ncbi:MAG: hypothetical protein B6244_08830 [Candidatus Cloacimonetes bacterium 4572_55]|nr:MAG: hypothetical protein B6244_08830 [Candidatus Cloacimonetes bacterium 4572_55]